MDSIRRRRLRWLRYLVTESCRYVWQAVKNGVKILLGRKPYRDDRLVFFRNYLLHLTGLRPIRAITCAVSSSYHGPGSQAFLVMWAISAARAFGFPYVHTPFARISHADRPMQEWAAAWETVFNLGAGEAPYEKGTRGVVNCAYGVENLDVCFELRRTGQLQDCFNALIPEFRRKYYLNKSPRTTREVTVAVHARRGDVSIHENSYMFTSNGKILCIASAVKSILESSGAPFSIRVYGQGTIADFRELSPLNAEFFLDVDPIWTLCELVEADILIVAKSYFSEYAGLISDGIKIFEEPCRWPLFSELADWLPCQPNGSFDRAAFERRLSLLLQAKEKTAGGVE